MIVIFSMYNKVDKKYGKSPDKLDEKIYCNKLCVDIIISYKYIGKYIKNLNTIDMIDTIMGWFEITEYGNIKRYRF